MGFQVSPGVVVTEKDLTTIVPSVSTTDGAFVGAFRWGPVDEIVLVGDENLLVKRFGKPDDNTATSFFTAANFLAYGDKLRIVRVVDDTVAKNATAAGAGLLIENDAVYDALTAQTAYGNWVAKFPGALGNSIKVSMCPSAEAFSRAMTGVYDGTVGNDYLTTTTDPINNVVVGSIITEATTGQQFTVTSIDSALTPKRIYVDVPVSVTLDDATLTTTWEYASLFGVAPGTSEKVAALGGTRDELHIVVVDKDGLITGARETVLERYSFLSKASRNTSADGASTYYVDVINRSSQYIRWLKHNEATTWGTAIGAVNYLPLAATANQLPKNDILTSGADGTNTSSASYISNRLKGYDLFKNPNTVDVSLIMLGDANSTTINYVVSNICEERMDCIAFFSPRLADVYNNTGDEVKDTLQFKNNANISSSYAVMDNNWKRQYDKYNDVYRWVPLNGDIAGICVRTDVNQDPWWSPAGYNRGLVKNVDRLAYNAYKSERDDLYINGVNPVISTPGQGTILFGDKTCLAKPSAFDRINVRRLFIVLEKAISRAAKFMLFEFNDEFTRQQFRNLVEPFLRDVQGRRGIYDFKVVCDRTNNTAEVIDRNEFVADIFIKPARAINFIQLNFVATRTGVSFEEVGA